MDDGPTENTRRLQLATPGARTAATVRGGAARGSSEYTYNIGLRWSGGEHSPVERAAGPARLAQSTGSQDSAPEILRASSLCSSKSHRALPAVADSLAPRGWRQQLKQRLQLLPQSLCLCGAILLLLGKGHHARRARRARRPWLRSRPRAGSAAVRSRALRSSDGRLSPRRRSRVRGR